MHQSKQGHTKVSCMDLVTYHLEWVCAEDVYLVLIQYDASMDGWQCGECAVEAW